MIFDVELRFNARISGPGQKWTGHIEAECVHEALDDAIACVLRNPGHGDAIFVTGCSVDERKPS